MPRFVCLLVFVLVCGTTYTHAASPRVIRGKVVLRESHAPAAGQRLALSRPPGNYPGIAMLVLGIPQSVVIATAVTDQRGRFEFTTRKDRQRYLRIHLAGLRRGTPLKPSSGLTVASLSDLLGPRHAEFDDNVIYYNDGRWGMRPYPRKRPNQAMERTTTRRAFTSGASRTSPLRATHALGGRHSSYSR